MEYLIILLVVGWLIYKFGNLSPQYRPSFSSPITIDDVISRGQLYQNLNKHMEGLGAKTDTPLPLRMSRFLSFGTEVARQAASISTPTNEMDAGPESAAILLFVQQGVHTLLTLEMGQDAVKTHNYKAKGAEIIEYAMWQIFRYENRNATDARGQSIFKLGTYMTKIAQVDNVTLLQKIFDAWDLFLTEASDEAVQEMGNAMREAANWCHVRLPSA